MMFDCLTDCIAQEYKLSVAQKRVDILQKQSTIYFYPDNWYLYDIVWNVLCISGSNIQKNCNIFK